MTATITENTKNTKKAEKFAVELRKIDEIIPKRIRPKNTPAVAGVSKKGEK